MSLDDSESILIREDGPSNPSLSCPIATIPLELLADILEICYSRLSGKNKFHFPLRVSLVSKSWRDLLQSTSALWTTIRASSVRTDGLREYLDRAESQSLDVTLDVKHSHGEPRITALLSILISKIHQWRQLNIYADEGPVLGMIAPRLLNAPAHRLETLHVLVLGDDRHLGQPWMFHMDAPRLTRVHISKSPLCYRTSNIFHGLSTLRLECLSSDGVPHLTLTDLRAIAESSPQLRELAVQLPLLKEGTGNAASSTVRLPALRSLELSSCPSLLDGSIRADDFWAFSAPSLERLSLQLPWHAWRTFIMSLMLKRFQRCFAHVVAIKLKNIPFMANIPRSRQAPSNAPRAMCELFISAFPSLQRLECFDTDPTALVKTLTAHLLGDKESWPHLACVTTNKGDWSDLVTLARLRAQHKRPLRVIHLPAVQGLSRRARELLEELEQHTNVEYYSPEDDDGGRMDLYR
ncbi:hypothetical protein GLOTRDRAFT_134928 [Gloeophyllum trabeum ATCC 11539]|uniref:Uncharacterized protein n=1 Tax=Gloeophyllum trabeum (strain ATCC 11539 / FP-39264 / Madison 617) TaxID=670483 RepID=S7QLG6_GLOTA|nr:uncharacterized protein GLOTRDRAFT_134928 [Gloeophyllum trabeum ATCC 11539]EPQ60203.1 hypothetical protein GLOTRDRAFT_134928 [Gloeophyllum trabeum ATCC 11539]